MSELLHVLFSTDLAADDPTDALLVSEDQLGPRALAALECESDDFLVGEVGEVRTWAQAASNRARRAPGFKV